MLAYKTPPPSSSYLLEEIADGYTGYATETFIEDVRYISELIRDGKLPPAAAGPVLSLFLKLYIASEADSLAYEIEDAFEGMFRNLLVSERKP